MASGATHRDASAVPQGLETDALRAQLVSRLADLGLRGMTKVPLPAGFNPSAAAGPSSGEAPTGAVGPAAQTDQSQRCGACPVCPAAGGKMESDARALEPGPLLVILEYPASEKSLQDDLADGSSPNHLIYRLLARANLLQETAFAYALRSPVKSLPRQQWIETCANQWLGKELAMRKPRLVLCFGARAKAALDTALARQGNFPAASIQVHTFPSPLELTSHPNWRQGVWEQVNALTLPKS